MHDIVVGVGGYRPGVSASRSGGETTAASHSEDSRVFPGSKWVFGAPKKNVRAARAVCVTMSPGSLHFTIS